jgi:hypothetical protein
MRILRSTLVGCIAAGIPCAIGLALTERHLNRGIGILGPSPLLAAIIGSFIGGFLGAIVGALVEVGRFGARTGAALGVLLGAACSVRFGSSNFYRSGYVDREALVSEIFTYAALVAGLGLSGFLAGRRSAKDGKRREEGVDSHRLERAVLPSAERPSEKSR